MEKMHVELAIEDIMQGYLFGSIDKAQVKERFEGLLSLIKYTCMKDEKLKTELKVIVVNEYKKLK